MASSVYMSVYEYFRQLPTYFVEHGDWKMSLGSGKSQGNVREFNSESAVRTLFYVGSLICSLLICVLTYLLDFCLFFFLYL